MKLTEFIVETRAGPLTCALAEPEKDGAAADSVLLLSVGGARMSAEQEPSPTVRFFVEAGHPVVSFDMPNHGDLVDRHGQSIGGMCAAFLAGDDPFDRFVDNGVAVIDACLEKGLADPQRIVVSGGSRGGYCALRLAAADRRINGTAALCPVTDWRCLKEFEAVKQQPEVAALALDHWAGELTGRPLFLLIGNHDHRVGTHACARFAARMFELEEPLTQGESATQFHVVTAPGHTLPEEWEIEAARFLLRLCGQGGEGEG